VVEELPDGTLVLVVVDPPEGLIDGEPEVAAARRRRPGDQGERVRIDVLTIFPEWFEGPLTTSLLGKAIDDGVLDVRVHDLRDWTTDRHRTSTTPPTAAAPAW
jgi:hypothetical protein